MIRFCWLVLVHIFSHSYTTSYHVNYVIFLQDGQFFFSMPTKCQGILAFDCAPVCLVPRRPHLVSVSHHSSSSPLKKKKKIWVTFLSVLPISESLSHLPRDFVYVVSIFSSRISLTLHPLASSTTLSKSKKRILHRYIVEAWQFGRNFSGDWQPTHLGTHLVDLFSSRST